ncbi:ABC transporter substrate-binding protein [Pelagicoccus sp. SDUM812003]|uniref:ABC transporter substrate-binding protein n=1 Tax=Pelagicoccus sp. SDUM812003 TaxID=3041267 RepID=UPI00280D3093|nr:ABC transporter substrate-binding protein [Pelagicoccus sp. SDUM812003]MDQ8205096.1 ABC transporter substrate-binding protein [Pelagicoccus sp. SDUM812003]
MQTELLDEEPSFPENEDGLPRKLDYLGYAPCPIRKEMQRRMHAYFRAHEAEFGQVDWFSPDGCFHGGSDNDPYDETWKTGSEEEMPGVMSDGGSSDFFTTIGRQRWIDSEIYGPIEKPSFELRPEIVEAGIDDPLGAMNLYATFPTVLLVDREKLGDKPAPKRWQDLADPIYRGDITLAGHDDSKLSDNMLFNTWIRFGNEGLEALARNAKQFWSPAQMVKAAGARHPDGTSIYCLNYFFAKGRRRSEKVEILWPEEGAFFQPLMVMGKRGRRPVSQLPIDYLYSEDWAQYLDSVGFPAVRSYPGQKPLPGKLSWTGWDFLRNNDLEALRDELNAVFKEARQTSCS